MIEISIIVPVYNTEKYIIRCINSVLKQTFRNWELILIDDGSIDSSGKICDFFQKKDNRIKVIHKKNEGVSIARNLGITLSKGNYITFIDSDDWVELDYLELMYKAIKEMNIDVIVSGCVYEDKNGPKNPFKKGKPVIYNKNEAKKEFFKQDRFIWTICDKLYKAELLKRVKLNTHLKIAEDMLLFWNIMNNVERIGYVPLYKYHYDRMASSTMSSDFSLKWFHSLKVKKYILEDVQKFSVEYKFLAKAVYIGEVAGLFKKIIKNNKYKTGRLTKILQKILRKNFYFAFYRIDTNVLTFRQRLGIIYACLPYKLCVFFLKIL